MQYKDSAIWWVKHIATIHYNEVNIPWEIIWVVLQTHGSVIKAMDKRRQKMTDDSSAYNFNGFWNTLGNSKIHKFWVLPSRLRYEHQNHSV